jgi:HSP20 family protein
MIYRKMYGVPSWRFASPFQELDRVKHMLDNLYSKESDLSFPSLHAGVFPSINLTEDKENYYIRAELPGITKENLDIETTGNNVSISGEREIPAIGKDARYHRREREAGKFSRVISLPGDINPELINANLANGILKLTIPKAEKAKPKQIKIN